MTTVGDVANFLEQFAPSRLAEEWDNVGLLVGDEKRPVCRLMTCLTITPSTTNEALKNQADLIVTHHPLPFRPLKRITTSNPSGRMLWELIGGQISIYSPHTAFDSAEQGINQAWADGLSLKDIRPLIPAKNPDVGSLLSLGSGRFGTLGEKTSLQKLMGQVKKFLGLSQLQWVGSPDRVVEKVAVACGSAGEFLEPALLQGCDCLITGETRFHLCLEAEAQDCGLILVGHFASERFAVERLAHALEKKFPEITIWPSRQEQDPLRTG